MDERHMWLDDPRAPRFRLEILSKCQATVVASDLHGWSPGAENSAVERTHKEIGDHMHMFKKSIPFAAVALVALVGCSKNSGSEPAPGASQGSEATPPETSRNTDATAMTDGQILQVLADVDSGEIAQAQVALTKAQSPAVREFAQHMVDQHTKSQQDAKQLEAGTKIIPSPSAAADDVHQKGSQTLDELKGADASSFDAAYMKAQIQQHQDVLNMLNEKLMPAASSSELRDALGKTKSMVQRHIDMAKQMQM